MRNRTLAQQNMLQKFRRFSGTWKPHQAKADGSKLEMKWRLAVFVKCLATTGRMADGKSESCCGCITSQYSKHWYTCMTKQSCASLWTHYCILVVLSPSVRQFLKPTVCHEIFTGISLHTYKHKHSTLGGVNWLQASPRSIILLRTN